jgi:hypothetical protein
LTPRLAGTVFEGWRGLGRFWIGVGVVLVACGVALQLLGPLPAPPPHVTASTPPAPAQPPAAVQPPVPPAPPKQAAAPAPPRPGRDTPGPIPDPDPALQEPVPGNMSDLVPQIAGDGRMPMQIYAAGFDASTRRPRVGLLLAGVGLNQADSEAAIRTLPGGITLAFSP